MEESVKRVLFVNSEMSPYLPESEIASIGRHLPQGIQEKKKETQNKLNELNQKKDNTLEYLQELDKQMELLEAEIEETINLKNIVINNDRRDKEADF